MPNSDLPRGHRTTSKRFSFLFMKADGGQLREITRLIDAGAIRPVIDRAYPIR